MTLGPCTLPAPIVCAGRPTSVKKAASLTIPVALALSLQAAARSRLSSLSNLIPRPYLSVASSTATSLAGSSPGYFPAAAKSFSS